MARGERARLDRAQLAAAVAAAERACGLEICVVVCQASAEPPRQQAERAFTRLALAGRPGVLVLLLPDTRNIEIVTSAEARRRVSDVDCERAASAMIPALARGDVAEGVAAGLEVIASAAGPGSGAEPGDAGELPDLVDT